MSEFASREPTSQAVSARVRDYMATQLVTLSEQTEILRAISLLIENEISGAPVVDDQGVLVGMLTERDCMRVALEAGYYAEYGGRVKEYMSTDTVTIDAQESLMRTAERFLKTPYRRYPVTDQDGRLIGQISRRDVLRALRDIQ